MKGKVCGTMYLDEMTDVNIMKNESSNGNIASPRLPFPPSYLLSALDRKLLLPNVSPRPRTRNEYQRRDGYESVDRLHQRHGTDVALDYSALHSD